jgi:oxygen-independent coproporphyrinogen-3 oxidase
MNKMEDFTPDFWQEYPERDTEYISYYPPKVSPVEVNDIWNKKELGLYFHIPFCFSICNYCPFNKFLWKEEKAKEYFQSLLKEISLVSKLNYVRDSNINVLNFGGGTPTTLSNDELEVLIGTIKNNFHLNSDIEITMEANPETVDSEKLTKMYELGINRISFGIQSFHDDFLELIGRDHNTKQSYKTLKLAREIGFDNIGIDLMYNIPGQTLDNWVEDLKRVIDIKIDHISLFSLFICPGTNLFQKWQSKKIEYIPDESREFEMYYKAVELLTSNGYIQNTVYDFVLPDKECKYHSMSWQAPQGEYIGLGAGANSHVNDAVYTNHSSIKNYINSVNNSKLPISFGSKISIANKISRFMVLGVKYLKVNKIDFYNAFGLHMDSFYKEQIDELVKNGLIENDSSSIKVTEKGKRFISNISKAFYSEDQYRVPQPIEIEIQKKEHTLN